MVVLYPQFSGQSRSGFHLVFSFAMARARWGLPGWASQIWDCLGIAASVPEVGVIVGLDLCHRWEKMVFLLWQSFMLLCSLWELNWCICSNLLDPFCRVSYMLVLDTCERLLVFCCFEDGKVWRRCDQCWVVEVLGPWGDSCIQCHCLIVCI